VVLVVRLVPVVQVVQVAHLVRLVPVAQVVLVAHLAQRVPDLADHVQDSVVAQVPVPEPALAHLAQAVARVPVADVVSAVEPRVRSVRAARAETQRPANPSAQNARNSNKELHRA
jgi:hypothetical protein